MNILRNIIDRVLLELRAGKSPKCAVDRVAKEYGISENGKVYAYLLKRAKEEVNHE